jgi:D-alanine-D-alanine ligase
MKILVLGGGASNEREVSLRSAAAVTKALRTAGYIVEQRDPAEGLTILNNLAPGTIVFPILHGKGSEDGTIQRELETRQLPFLGSDSSASATCFDKWLARQAMQAACLPVAKGELVTKDSYLSSSLASKPHVLKVTDGGSSLGTYVIKDPLTVDPLKVNEIFALSDKVLVEEMIFGIEITVPILDDIALPVIEIRIPADGEFDYENKYNGASEELCPPVSINDEVQHKAQNLALEIHKLLKCRHLSRADMIVRPDNELVILETNTMPGMTDQSLYPKSAQAAGLDFPALCRRFVELVARDYNLAN